MGYVSKAVFTLMIGSALAVSAAATASDAYKVSATLSHAGEVFASPNAVVSADKEAKIEVSGENGYAFTFTVTESTPEQIQVVANLTSEHGSMNPTVVVRPDIPATVSVGDLTLEITVSRSDG